MTTTAPSVLFRADASPSMGIGHVMRCLTLARELAGRGWTCRFACSPETPATVAALRASGFEIVSPDAAPPSDWAVVDHYGLDQGYERPLRSRMERILVIDDLADRRHDCDILLDQTVGRDRSDYVPLAPPSALILAGAKHALLRPEFTGADAPARRLRGNDTILVSLGGTDPSDSTSLVLEALALANLNRPVSVVMGSAAPALENVRRTAARLSPPAEVFVDVSDMAGLMGACGLAIGAAGSSALERCCLGLPTLLLVIADNQKAVARGLEQAGAAVTVPLDAAAIAAKLYQLVHDEAALALMAERARHLCDGHGAARLADLMSLTLRPATLEDGEDLLRWRNDPVTRANSLDTAEVQRDGHFSWLEHTLNDPERVLLMAEREGNRLGMARFDTMAPGLWRVSISVAPAARGQGLGAALLSAAILHLERRHGPAEFQAEIRAANRPSQRIFEDCGFVRTDADGGVFYYRRARPEAIS